MDRRKEDLFWLWKYLNGLSASELRAIRRKLCQCPGSQIRFTKKTFGWQDVMDGVNHYLEIRMSEEEAMRFYREFKFHSTRV